MSNVSLISFSGDDLSVVNAARVSFDKESSYAHSSVHLADKCLKLADERLIHYLAKHRHLSPFNHAFASFRVTMPIFVARQLVKHEYMPWNEVSRRYVDDPPSFHYPTAWRKRADNVKQGSSDETVDTMLMHDVGLNEVWKTEIDNVYALLVEQSMEIYNRMLEAGVCPEQARMILPQSMMTTVVWSGSLGAIAKMLSLRLPKDTQVETREVAEQIYNILEPIFPISLKALLTETYGLEIV